MKHKSLLAFYKFSVTVNTLTKGTECVLPVRTLPAGFYFLIKVKPTLDREKLCNHNLRPIWFGTWAYNRKGERQL